MFLIFTALQIVRFARAAFVSCETRPDGICAHIATFMRTVALYIQSVNQFFALHRSVVAVVVMFNVEHKLKIAAFCF